MADATITTKTYNDTVCTFIESGKVRIYPCANRTDYDLESKLNTEHNIVSPGYIDTSYVISENSGSYKIVLGGYYIEIDDLPTTLIDENLKVSLLLKENNLLTTSSEETSIPTDTTKTVASFFENEGNVGTSKLDVVEGGVSYFTGLCLHEGDLSLVDIVEATEKLELITLSIHVPASRGVIDTGRVYNTVNNVKTPISTTFNTATLNSDTANIENITVAAKATIKTAEVGEGLTVAGEAKLKGGLTVPEGKTIKGEVVGAVSGTAVTATSLNVTGDTTVKALTATSVKTAELKKNNQPIEIKDDTIKIGSGSVKFELSGSTLNILIKNE